MNYANLNRHHVIDPVGPICDRRSEVIANEILTKQEQSIEATKFSENDNEKWS